MRSTDAPLLYVMPSNELRMSFSFSIGWRILRAVTSESARSALRRICTSARSPCQLGSNFATILVSIQFAKPSLSQMSSHHAVVTRSPNHWCANSCDATEMYETRLCRSEEHTSEL